MSEEKENSREILTYIRERDEARDTLKKVQDELQTTKSKLYDANCKLEDLKKSQPKNDKGAQKSGTGKQPAKKGAAASAPAKGGNNAKSKPAPAVSAAAAASEPAEVPKSADTPPSGVRHPPVEGLEHLCDNTYAYYSHIAQKFPQVKLQTVLDAEKKFNAADVNGDGVIDKDELDGVLDTTLGLLLSKSAVENIITSIDKDSNGTLDFFEVLQIVATRRNTQALPAAMQHNPEKVCSIQ